MKENTKKKDKDWFDIASEHHDEENYAQALVAINKYVENHPKSKSGKLLKAVIYRDLANYTLAIQLLEEIKPTPKDKRDYSIIYFLELGRTYKEKGDYKRAIKWYDKGIAISPDETIGYIYKGACLAAAGKYELAKIEHLKATKLAGDPEEAFYNLALITRAEMKFAAAKEYCEQSLAIDPNDKNVQHCYNDILLAIQLIDKK